ncbi:hypothetical protein D3C71_1955640 [compost metagenome]
MRGRRWGLTSQVSAQLMMATARWLVATTDSMASAAKAHRGAPDACAIHTSIALAAAVSTTMAAA